MSKTVRYRLLAVAGMLTLALGVAACSEDSTQSKAAHQGSYHTAEVNRAGFRPYIPKHAVEFSNYNHAQQVYDDPSTIVWCSTTWGNPSAPIITVPIAGKLTSSTVSFFANKVEKSFGSDSGTFYPELTSVDGMYHGTPPPYRYGFTPGGQYVDFFNMPTLCTTALNSFQRQVTKVSVKLDPAAAQAQHTAEAALRAGQQVAPDGSVTTTPQAKAAAQRALEQAVGG